MLVLGRRRDEVIHIGDDITVIVVRTGVSGVRLGIKCPRGVQVLRGELRERGENGLACCGNSEHDDAVLPDGSEVHDALPHATSSNTEDDASVAVVS